MSNNYRLVCLSHEGGEQYSDEVGNNNAKPASLAVKNRENIGKMAEMLAPLDLRINDVAHAHWDNYMIHAIMFVSEHPKCELELHDEYGALVAFEDEPDPHDGPDKFCSKCGGRRGNVGVPVGGGEFADLKDVCVAQDRDRAKISFVHWFKKGYNYLLEKEDQPFDYLDEVSELKKFSGFEEGWLLSLSGANPFSKAGQEAKALQLYNQKLEREKKD